MAFTPVLPNIVADIAAGPPVGLADVRNTLSITMASAESNLPASTRAPLANARTKVSSFLASFEAKLPTWHPKLPTLPTTLAGRPKRQLIPQDTGGVREVVPGQTSLQSNRVSGVAKQVTNVYTSSGF
jgi:hypothetical protein